METVTNEVRLAISKHALPKVSNNVGVLGMGHAVPDSAYRQPVTGGRVLQVTFVSAPPAGAQVSRTYSLLLPRDAASDDDIQLVSTNPADTFTARVDEVIPALSGVLQIRLSMFAERLVGEILHQLKELAEKSIRGNR